MNMYSTESEFFKSSDHREESIQPLAQKKRNEGANRKIESAANMLNYQRFHLARCQKGKSPCGYNEPKNKASNPIISAVVKGMQCCLCETQRKLLSAASATRRKGEVPKTQAGTKQDPRKERRPGTQPWGTPATPQ